MQVAPVTGLGDEINQIRLLTADIVTKEIIPNENALRSGSPEKRRDLFRGIQAKVKQAGLWAPHLPEEYGGMGIGFLKHAYMNEIMAWSPFSSSLFGCQAPNSGNQTILVKYGTPEQKKQWLEPLVRGEIESCFSMTEPNNPGSDPYAIQTRAVKDGNDWVINGHKWFTSNGRRAAFAIVMCRTEGDDDGQRRARPHDPDHRPDQHAGLQHHPQRSGVGTRAGRASGRVLVKRTASARTVKCAAVSFWPLECRCRDGRGLCRCWSIRPVALRDVRHSCTSEAVKLGLSVNR